jgi:hypothetical protein
MLAMLAQALGQRRRRGRLADPAFLVGNTDNGHSLVTFRRIPGYYNAITQLRQYSLTPLRHRYFCLSIDLSHQSAYNSP